MPFDQPPSRADLLAWLGMVDPGTSPDEYDLCLEVALEGQEARCDVTLYSAALHEAALRRAAREVSGRGMSLGIYDSPDFGQQYLPRWDALVEAQEMPKRLGGFA